MSFAARVKSPFIFHTPKYVEVICDPNYSGTNMENVEFIKNDTIWTLAKHMAKEIPDHPLFGARQYDKEKGVFTEYKFITYAETVALAEQFACGLVELGLKKADVCTEYFVSRIEWQITDLALFRQAATASPLRHGLNKQYYKQVILLTEPTMAVVSPDNINELFDMCDDILRDGKPLTYKSVVVLPQPIGPLEGTESIKAEQYERVKGLGIRLIKYEEVMELGKAHPHPEEEQDPASLHSIVFTSGTTSSQPKGVPVKQRGMLCCNARQSQYKNMTFYSYSHMSHISERGLMANTIGTQSCVGFASGTVATMLDDMEVLKPTLILIVPSVLKILQGKAFELMRSGVDEKTASEIFRKKFGGRCDRCECFGAPCPEELCQWVIDFLGMRFSTTYGLTEGSATATISPYVKKILPFGCIGQPGPLATLRLIDAPELGFSIHDDPPAGELLIRSPGNMPGYLKNPEKTAATLDDEGFVHTSDICKLNDDGTFTIIDRRDNMMKLGNAAYIPPEQIEAFFSMSQIVAQPWVYARPQDDFLITIVVPNLQTLSVDPRLPAELKEQVIAAAKDPASEVAAAVCANPAIVNIYKDEFAKIGEKNHFPGYWSPKGILLEPVRWTETANLLAYGGKLKRKQLLEKYHDKIDEFVASL